MATTKVYRKSPLQVAVWIAGFVATLTAAWTVAAAPPAPTELPAPVLATAPLSLNGAIRLALQQNPEIAAMRQQHGIAAAGVVIARAYPFNPLWENRVRSAFPASAGTTNRTPFETTVLLELELRGQGKFRKAAASAVLTRTDWEIAAQETTLAVRTIRAFDAVVYRFQKNQLVLDTIELDRKTVGKTQNLVDAGKQKPADLIILRSELDDARAQLGQSRTALATAWNDLRSALGVVGGGAFDLQGDLIAPPLPPGLAPALAETAREHRPDRHAREVAIAEADALLRLEVANRYGNVTAGPTYEFDNSSINNVGAMVSMPLPVLNAHRGLVLQRQAEKARAALDLRQVDVQIDQQIEAALTRLAQARAWAETYTRDVLPNLDTNLKDVQLLFDIGDPTVGALQILDVQRKAIKAHDGLLDAQFEVRQAVADLAAALGDPATAVGPCPAP
jgi:cobalt-zinc-cadmium efflux system outer membrane protein